jgi:hypothetical protein
MGSSQQPWLLLLIKLEKRHCIASRTKGAAPVRLYLAGRSGDGRKQLLECGKDAMCLGL